MFLGGHAQGIKSATGETLIEMLVCVFLNGKTFVLEEGEILDELRGFVEIDQDADTASFCGRENGAEKPDQIELWEFAIFRMEEDFFFKILG
jgi:hypothetical protein